MYKTIVFAITVWLIILLAACTIPTPLPTPTMDAQVVLTGAAQTAYARLTETASFRPSDTPPPTPDLAQTAAIQLQQTAALETLAISPTPVTTLTTPTPSALLVSDRAQYVKDVTVQDGDDFKPGASFRKTWRIKNVGFTTWTPDYAVVFIDGERMGAPELVRLSGEVKPGEEVDISVDLVAPLEEGRYRGWFKMVNPQGIFFDDAFYVEIEVMKKKK